MLSSLSSRSSCSFFKTSMNRCSAKILALRDLREEREDEGKQEAKDARQKHLNRQTSGSIPSYSSPPSPPCCASPALLPVTCKQLPWSDTLSVLTILSWVFFSLSPYSNIRHAPSNQRSSHLHLLVELVFCLRPPHCCLQVLLLYPPEAPAGSICRTNRTRMDERKTGTRSRTEEEQTTS